MTKPHGPGEKNVHIAKQDCYTDDFGLRSPVIQSLFLTKSATSNVARVHGSLAKVLPAVVLTISLRGAVTRYMGCFENKIRC